MNKSIRYVSPSLVTPFWVVHKWGIGWTRAARSDDNAHINGVINEHNYLKHAVKATSVSYASKFG